MDGPAVTDLEMAGGMPTNNDNALDSRRRAGNRMDRGMKTSLRNRKYLKEATVIVEVVTLSEVKAVDII